jgi:hypothetical protein
VSGNRESTTSPVEGAGDPGRKKNSAPLSGIVGCGPRCRFADSFVGARFREASDGHFEAHRMQVKHLQYTSEGAWSEPLPAMDGPSTLVLIFGDSESVSNPAPFDQLRRALPRAQILGCSTSGQILNESIHDGGLVVSILKFERTRIRVARATAKTAEQSHEAGRCLAMALQGPDLKGVFVLSDGTSINGTLLSLGLRTSLGSHIPATGGLAGDGARFQKTWVCCNGGPERGVVAAVGFYGEAVEFMHGCKGGWDPFGPERLVTRSTGNKLFELDGKPALAIYEEYLGERAAELPASALLFPLALRRPDEAHTVVRTVLAVSREENSMTFAGDIPAGSIVQLMKGNFDRIIDAASHAAGMMPLHNAGTDPGVCLSISCVGRRLILRHRAEEELEEVRALLPEGLSQIGFYSYGELSPLMGSNCELHNQTMTLTVITEKLSTESGHASHARETAA